MQVDEWQYQSHCRSAVNRLGYFYVPTHNMGLKCHYQQPHVFDKLTDPIATNASLKLCKIFVPVTTTSFQMVFVLIFYIKTMVSEALARQNQHQL